MSHLDKILDKTFGRSKKCKECGIEYHNPSESFYKDRTKKDGFHSLCKSCEKEYKKQYREAHRDDLIKRDAEYYQNHKEEKDAKTKVFRKKAMEKSELDVDYSALHQYIKRRKASQNYCEICKKNKPLDLASINHTYTRNIEDWKYLCRECHIEFDSPRALIISEKSETGIKGSQDESCGSMASFRDSKPIIDFSYLDWSYLANNSSFQRGVMEFIKKNVPGLENIEVRGSKEAMATSFNKNKQNYGNVIKEFEEKLAKVKNHE